MSNAIVGSTYASIIQKVIDASENDFLENGVDQSLLAELRQGWEKRLTDLKGAQYPWDPQPPVNAQPPTVPSNAPKVEPSPVPAHATVPSQQQPANGAYNGPPIKTEVKTENSFAGPPQQKQPQAYQSGLDRNLAAQRAQSFLQQGYGDAAAQSIAQIQAQQSQGQQRPPNMQAGMQQRQPPPMNLQLPAQRQQQHNLYQAQHDGAADAAEDWAAHVATIKATAEADRQAADGVIRSQVTALSNAMDSGLLVPLDEQPSMKRNKLKATARRNAAKSKSDPIPSATSSSTPPISQLDGVSDDDEKVEHDEDAINSDLDDPEEEDPEEDEDSAEIGDIMLCTYDKVQRVKNKWKCTLKDGVLTTHGKDYLFHKATGEFEW